MNTTVLELNGTAEEIQHRLAEYPGQQLHVTIRPIKSTYIEPPIQNSRKLTITGEQMTSDEKLIYAYMKPEVIHHRTWLYSEL